MSNNKIKIQELLSLSENSLLLLINQKKVYKKDRNQLLEHVIAKSYVQCFNSLLNDNTTNIFTNQLLNDIIKNKTLVDSYVKYLMSRTDNDVQLERFFSLACQLEMNDIIELLLPQWNAISCYSLTLDSIEEVVKNDNITILLKILKLKTDDYFRDNYNRLCKIGLMNDSVDCMEYMVDKYIQLCKKHENYSNENFFRDKFLTIYEQSLIQGAWKTTKRLSLIHRELIINWCPKNPYVCFMALLDNKPKNQMFLNIKKSLTIWYFFFYDEEVVNNHFVKSKDEMKQKISEHIDSALLIWLKFEKNDALFQNFV